MEDKNITLSKQYDEIVFPTEGEQYIEYRDRITINKTSYNLTWQDIKDLVNCFYNIKLSDNWRKFYYFSIEKEKHNIENCTRILCISDIHIPFNLPVDILSDYRNKVDTLIINGDLLDCYSLSKFTKLYRKPLIDELIKARQYVVDMIDLIKPKKVIAITGNHEIRLGRIIADKIGSDLLDLMPTDAMAFIFDTGFNSYDHQTKTKTIYEPLDKVFDKIGIECIYANNFWYQEGKTIFVHPMAFKQSPLSTSVKAYEYFISKHLDFDTISMAHTHHLGYTKYGEYHLFEQGCLANLKDMNYMDMKLPKVGQVNGFIYLLQDENGNLDYDKSKLEVL